MLTLRDGRPVSAFERSDVRFVRYFEEFANLHHAFRWIGGEVFIIQFMYLPALRLKCNVSLPQTFISQVRSFGETCSPEKTVIDRGPRDASHHPVNVAPQKNEACVRKLFCDLQCAVVPMW